MLIISTYEYIFEILTVQHWLFGVTIRNYVIKLSEEDWLYTQVSVCFSRNPNR